MVQIRCQDCGRIVTVKKDWDTDSTCEDCAGSFEELNSEDDTYEEEQEEDEETFECSECEEEFDKEDNLIYFENSETYICKECINKVYPRKIEVKTEYKEKIIEKPIIKYLNNQNQEVKVMPKFEEVSRFD
jgi:hypothetical protein